MKDFNKLLLSIVIFLLIFGGILNIVAFTRFHQTNINRGHEIAINRYINDRNYDYSKYGINRALEVDYSINKEQLERLFSREGLANSEDYIIRITYDNGKPQSYIKFIYNNNMNNTKEVILFINMILAVSIILTLSCLIFVKKRMIEPFDKIKNMPEQLAKGVMVSPIKESKQSYFGQFLWGLDMLRDVLNKEKAQSRILEKDKKLLVLSLSHDIKTPLSSIELYAKALNEGLYKDENKQKEIAKKIQEKVWEINSYIGEIVNSQRDNIIEIEVLEKEFYLSELVNKIKTSYKEKLKLLMIDFHIDKYDDVLLFGDFDKTCQVLENVIENSIKYGDGRVIQISFLEEDYCTLITVFNSGTPIDKDDTVHLFDSFWRGKNAKDKNGSGLGLYICKEITHKMNGDIFAEWEDDGMKFTVVLKQK